MNEPLRSRYDEYLICRDRGHVSAGYTTDNGEMWKQCGKCQTLFRVEQVTIERNPPEPPK